MRYTKPKALTYHAIRIFYKRGTVYFHILSIKRRMNECVMFCTDSQCRRNRKFHILIVLQLFCGDCTIKRSYKTYNLAS